MEEWRVCSVCDSNKNIIEHHLSYDPEILVPLCRRHHFAIHYYASVSQRGRLLFNEWVDKYGHLWVNGEREYRNSSQGKLLYNAGRRRRRKINPAYDKASEKWKKDHPDKAKEIRDRYYKKLKEDPLRYGAMIDRIIRGQKKRKNNALGKS